MILIGNGEKRGEKADCDSRLGEQVEKTRERAKQDRLKEMPSAYPPFTHSLLRQALIKPCLCASVLCEHLLVVNQTEKVSPFTLSHGGGCKQCLRVCLVTLSCPAFCNPMDCSPPGSSVCGISQAGILERVAISFSKGSCSTPDMG